MRRTATVVETLAASLVAVVALAACGSSAKPAAAPPATTSSATNAPATAPASTTSVPTTFDSCALVTQAQADALIGTKLEPPLHVSTTDVNSCTYPGDPNGPTAQVEVYIGPGAKTYYDDDNNVLHHMFTDVPGLGDESHEEDYALFFRKGPTWVALRVTSLDPFSTFKPRLEALAQDVASRI